MTQLLPKLNGVITMETMTLPTDILKTNELNLPLNRIFEQNWRSAVGWTSWRFTAHGQTFFQQR